MAYLDVLPPAGASQVCRHELATIRDWSGKPSLIGLDGFYERKDVLGMEDAGHMTYGNSAHIQTGGLGICYKTVLIVVDRNAKVNISEQIFHLHARLIASAWLSDSSKNNGSTCCSKKSGSNLNVREDGRRESAAGYKGFELVGENGRGGLF